MIFKIVDKKDILSLVTKEAKKAKKEIFVTMLLSEERKFPLPLSYHKLLAKKVTKGVRLKRIGFGTKKDYAIIRRKYLIQSKLYEFRYLSNIKKYQRMIIVDSKHLFFSVAETFLYSRYDPIINVFRKYFVNQFKRASL